MLKHSTNLFYKTTSYRPLAAANLGFRVHAGEASQQIDGSTSPQLLLLKLYSAVAAAIHIMHKCNLMSPPMHMSPPPHSPK